MPVVVCINNGGAALAAVAVERSTHFDIVRTEIAATVGRTMFGAVQYVDDECDLITVDSDAEWREALNFCQPDGTLQISLTGLPETEYVAVDHVAAGNTDQEYPHHVPCRVARNVITRRNTKYIAAGTPPNMPRVTREAAPMAADADDWELLEAAPAPSPSPPSGSVTLKVNGVQYTVSAPEPEAKLVDFLRKEANLSGTKIGCGEGGCGACTVLLHSTNHAGQTRTRHINSCLRPLAACDGMEVSTVESVGSQETKLHPVQKELAEMNGSQCGLCTPGWVMAMMGMLANNPKPTPEEIEHHFDGNICRCTGYRPILETMQSFAGEGAPPAPRACGGCCAAKEVADQPLVLHSATGATWMRPTTLQEALRLRALHGGDTVRLVGGNTGIGVEKYYNENLAFDSAPVYIDISRLAELTNIVTTADAITLGSALPINDLCDALDQAVSASPAVTATLPELARHARLIANNQVAEVQ